MYIDKQVFTDKIEPSYTITESTIVEDYPGEIQEQFIRAFTEAQDIVQTIWMIDDVTDEEVEIEAESYFTPRTLINLTKLLESGREITEGELTSESRRTR